MLNDGDVAIDLTVELKATAQVQAPEVLLVETGSALRITKTLQAGESFTISTVYGRQRVIYPPADRA